jgi:hypothetical protein
MSDAVKAALDAARMGICRTLDINPGEPPCEKPCLLCREGSAAAVAAFLRALPTMHFRITPGHVAILGQRGLEELAAAVTRAAQEDKR